MKEIKLTETNGSFKCVLPKDVVIKLGWLNGDILQVTDRAGSVKLVKKVVSNEKL